MLNLKPGNKHKCHIELKPATAPDWRTHVSPSRALIHVLLHLHAHAHQIVHMQTDSTRARLSPPWRLHNLNSCSFV
eukprot:5832556-Lingulodinium_polyedra.AAC.1